MSLTAMKMAPDAIASVVIRMAGPQDAAALHRLAALDSARYTGEPMLVAEVGEELWAAASLDGELAIADPFRPSGALLDLAAERARQLQVPVRASRTGRRAFFQRARRARPAT